MLLNKGKRKIGLRTTGPGGVAILLGPSSCRKQVTLRSCWVDCGFQCVFTLHFAYYLIDGTREYKPHLSPQTVRNSFEYQVMCLNGTVHTNSPTIKRQHCSGGSRGGARAPREPRHPPPPLIFRPNWGSKGWKKFFGHWVPPPPPPPLSKGLDNRPPPYISSSGSGTALT